MKKIIALLSAGMLMIHVDLNAQSTPQNSKPTNTKSIRQHKGNKSSVKKISSKKYKSKPAVKKIETLPEKTSG